MSILKNINKIPDKIYKEFEESNPEFLIIGINKVVSPQGTQYRNFGNYAQGIDDRNSFLANDSIVHSKTFQVGDMLPNQALLIKEAKEYVAAKSKEQRRIQYETLKKEFEPELITP